MGSRTFSEWRGDYFHGMKTGFTTCSSHCSSKIVPHFACLACCQFIVFLSLSYCYTQIQRQWQVSQFRASDKGASERRSGFSRLLSNNGWQRHCEGWCHVNHVSHWNTHNRVLTICAFSGHQEPATGMWWLGMCILYVRTIYACI